MSWLAAATGENHTLTLYEIKHTLFFLFVCLFLFIFVFVFLVFFAFSESLFAKKTINKL